MGKIIVEACVDNIESALAAEAAGADRVELCSALLEGGLTPSYGLIKATRKYLHIPIHVLIRPRRGDFLYSSKELEVMKDDIEFSKDLGIDAVVFGVLNQAAEVDIEAVQALKKKAEGMKTTFHRAFDMLSKPQKALKEIMALGFDSASTLNLNVNFGKMTMALLAQAATYQFRQKLPKEYRKWDAEHLANAIFNGLDGDIRVKDDTIIITCYNVPEQYQLENHYTNLPKRLEEENIDPRIPGLYNYKLDFRFNPKNSPLS